MQQYPQCQHDMSRAQMVRRQPGPTRAMRRHTRSLNAIAFCNIWDFKSRRKALHPPVVKHTYCANSVCFSPDGKRLATTVPTDDMVVVWGANVKTDHVHATLSDKLQEDTDDGSGSDDNYGGDDNFDGDDNFGGDDGSGNDDGYGGDNGYGGDDSYGGDDNFGGDDGSGGDDGYGGEDGSGGDGDDGSGGDDGYGDDDGFGDEGGDGSGGDGDDIDDGSGNDDNFGGEDGSGSDDDGTGGDEDNTDNGSGGDEDGTDNGSGGDDDFGGDDGSGGDDNFGGDDDSGGDDGSGGDDNFGGDDDSGGDDGSGGDDNFGGGDGSGSDDGSGSGGDDNFGGDDGSGDDSDDGSGGDDSSNFGGENDSGGDDGSNFGGDNDSGSYGGSGGDSDDGSGGDGGDGSGGDDNDNSGSDNGRSSYNIFTSVLNLHTTEVLLTQANNEDGNDDYPYSTRQAPNREWPNEYGYNTDHLGRQAPNREWPNEWPNEDPNSNDPLPRRQASNHEWPNKDANNNDPLQRRQPPNHSGPNKSSKNNSPHLRRQQPNRSGPNNGPRPGHQPPNHPVPNNGPRSGHKSPNRPRPNNSPRLGRHTSNHPGPSNDVHNNDAHPMRQPPNRPGPNSGGSNNGPRPGRQPPNRPGPNDGGNNKGPRPGHQPLNRPGSNKDVHNNDAHPERQPPNRPGHNKDRHNNDAHPERQPPSRPLPNSKPGKKHKIDEANQVYGQSLYDVRIQVFPTVWDASVAGDLHTAEELLTQDIDKDGNKDNSYAIRSVVRARNSEWDNALQDAVKSLAIQPSLWGYISKGIALCGNEQLWDAMEAFDLAITFSDRDPITIDLLLLIKAVTLFNAGRHNEALRRVQRLAIADQHSNALQCSVVNAYLRMQLAIITFQNGQYSEAADELTASITNITGLFSPATLLEPRWKIFTLLFGWDFDSLWRTVNQRRCDAFLRADRVTEAVKSFQYMMSMIDDNTKSGCLEWSTTFKQDCIARCVAKGDEAIAASNYEMAVELYSAAIKLDSSHDSFFARRSTANLARKHYTEALADADTVIKLSPSSRRGSELKHAALRGAQHSDKKTNETFESMLSKLQLTNAPDPQIRALRQQYTDAENAIKGVIDAHLEKAPLRLLNTSSGRLCNQDAQINAFMESKEYSELLYSSMTHAPLQMKPIKKAVAKYFSWVMLSHRWDKEEPTLHDIQGKVLYELRGVSGIEKLQMFCKKTRGMGVSLGMERYMLYRPEEHCRGPTISQLHVRLVSPVSSYNRLLVGCLAFHEIGCTGKQCLDHTRMDCSGVPGS
ncbi:hypothetical protein EDB19DRAFT_1317616 [Suillus lakei]|nr:hypothetical protein EDB19DRAFT_1317616 [Suillus lakei]